MNQIKQFFLERESPTLKKVVIKNLSDFTGEHLFNNTFLRNICKRLLLETIWNSLKIKNVKTDSHQRYSVRKGILRKFANITEKHLRLQQAEVCNFIKKETLLQVSSCDFCENSKKTFFAEHLWATTFIKKRF